MKTTRAISQFIDDVIAGNPLAIGVAVVMGAAMFGIIVL